MGVETTPRSDRLTSEKTPREHARSLGRVWGRLRAFQDNGDKRQCLGAPSGELDVPTGKMDRWPISAPKGGPKKKFPV
jgi:hypothetical protein